MCHSGRAVAVLKGFLHVLRPEDENTLKRREMNVHNIGVVLAPLRHQRVAHIKRKRRAGESEAKRKRRCSRYWRLLGIAAILRVDVDVKMNGGVA